eukprot:scaffold227404_cov22-Tisochrysis_lutea.AAC.1
MEQGELVQKKGLSQRYDRGSALRTWWRLEKVRGKAGGDVALLLFFSFFCEFKQSFWERKISKTIAMRSLLIALLSVLIILSRLLTANGTHAFVLVLISEDTLEVHMECTCTNPRYRKRGSCLPQRAGAAPQTALGRQPALVEWSVHPGGLRSRSHQGMQSNFVESHLNALLVGENRVLTPVLVLHLSSAYLLAVAHTALKLCLLVECLYCAWVYVGAWVEVSIDHCLGATCTSSVHSRSVLHVQLLLGMSRKMVHQKAEHCRQCVPGWSSKQKQKD